MSSKRSSRSRPPEEGEDVAQENGAVGQEDGAPPSAPSKAAPVSVGRSLELASSPDVSMDLIIDKLKFLNYETEFCKRKKPYRKPLSRIYFAVSSGNQSEQFSYFASLAVWLLNLCKLEVPSPKEHDDPLQICSTIISGCRRLGFAAPPFHPTKLREGSGREVCGVLEALVDFALETSGFSVKRPVYQPDGYPEEEAGEEDADAALEGMDEMAVPSPNELDSGLEPTEEDELSSLNPEKAAAGRGGAGGGSVAAKGSAAALVSERAVLNSKVDPVAWRVEMERVAPRLRIMLTADAKDWRMHLDEAHAHQEAINRSWPDSRAALERLRADLLSSLEKLQTRERFLNESFEHLMQNYRSARGSLLQIQEGYNKKSEQVSDRRNELDRLAEQLEEVRAQLDDKAGSLDSAGPVVRIKGAIKKLLEELKEMEVRLGVVSHTLLDLGMRNRRLLQAQGGADEDDDLDD